MTDYAAEQQMELEALEAILMDQFCGPLDGPRPSGWPADVPAYRVIVTPSSDEDAGEAAAAHDKQLDIVFAYPPTYPDAPPLLKPRSVRGLSDAELAAVSALMDEQVEANGGMPMMYAVVAAAQDWLRETLAKHGAVDASAAATTAATKSKEALAEEEEARAAAARALGTPVTRDTFAEWRAAFDAEHAGVGGVVAAAGPGTPADERPTGRQWFTALEARGGNAADTDDDGEEGDWEPVEDEAGDLEVGDDDDEDDDFLDELEEELAGKGDE